MFKSRIVKVKNGLLLSSVMGVLLSFASLANANNELEFGSVAMDIPAIMHERLNPLTY